MTEGRHPIAASAEKSTRRRQPASRAAAMLARLLALQCRRAGALAGLLLGLDEDKSIRLLAVHPPLEAGGAPGSWLRLAEASCRRVFTSGKSTVVSDPADRAPGVPQQHLILTPVKTGKYVRAVAAFVVSARHRSQLLSAQEKLSNTSLLLSHLELKMAAESHRKAIDRLHLALDVVSVVNRSEQFLGAAMALCNELAQHLGCTRASLGFLQGRYVRVRAVSRTDTFRPQMRLIQDIEAAMEECLDQDAEIPFPAPPDSAWVGRAAKHLGQSHGPSAVLSVPLRQNGQAAAVMTLERPPDRPFGDIDEIESVRLACELCTPRLMQLRQSSRWFGARAGAWAREKLSALVGPQHPWVKVSAVFFLLSAAFVLFAKGQYRIEAPFLFEASVRQSVVAPFDSFVKAVSVEPGDEVSAERTVLGELETADLRLKLAVLKADQMGHRKQRASSMRDGRTAEAQMAEAEIEKLDAEIRLCQRYIEQATLVAPIAGRIVSEDLKRQLGAPVKAGDVLFEIANVEKLRAELYVPEESIAMIRIGQTGKLATVGHPDRKISFAVERISPMAEVVDQKNVFTVRARLIDRANWMRPGMEGVAKISAGKRSYGWIWSHRVTDWLRMKLWL